jgi:hypothetical protein
MIFSMFISRVNNIVSFVLRGSDDIAREKIT